MAAAVTNIFRYGLRDEVINGPGVSLTGGILRMESKWQGKAKRMEPGNFIGFDTLHARKDFGIPMGDSECSGCGAAEKRSAKCQEVQHPISPSFFPLSFDLLRAVFIELW